MPPTASAYTSRASSPSGDRLLDSLHGRAWVNRKQSPSYSRIGTTSPSTSSQQLPSTTALNLMPSGAAKLMAQVPPAFRPAKVERWLFNSASTSERVSIKAPDDRDRNTDFRVFRVRAPARNLSLP